MTELSRNICADPWCFHSRTGFTDLNLDRCMFAFLLRHVGRSVPAEALQYVDFYSRSVIVFVMYSLLLKEQTRGTNPWYLRMN